MIHIIIDLEILKYTDENRKLIIDNQDYFLSKEENEAFVIIVIDNKNFYSIIRNIMIYLMSINVPFHILNFDYNSEKIDIVNEMIKFDNILMEKYGEFLLQYLKQIEYDLSKYGISCNWNNIIESIDKLKTKTTITIL